MDEFDAYYSAPELIALLRADFLRTQGTVITDILDASYRGDWEAAHRLVHTLRGSAGLLGEKKLQTLAADAEKKLKNGDTSLEWLAALSEETERVLAQPAQTQTSPPQAPLDAPHADKLLDELEELLAGHRGNALRLLDALAQIPHTETLIQQISDFEFGAALESLRVLRRGRSLPAAGAFAAAPDGSLHSRKFPL